MILHADMGLQAAKELLQKCSKLLPRTFESLLTDINVWQHEYNLYLQEQNSTKICDPELLNKTIAKEQHKHLWEPNGNGSAWYCECGYVTTEDRFALASTVPLYERFVVWHWQSGTILFRKSQAVRAILGRDRFADCELDTMPESVFKSEILWQQHKAEVALGANDN